MTIKQVIKKGTKILKESRSEEPKTKSRILMEYILRKPRQYLIINDDKELDENSEKNYFDKIKKIKNGIPLEYITNKKEFMKLNFYVDENVLVPRQDTEILVEEVIEIARKNNLNNILDLCTGSRLYWHITCKIS